MIDKPDIANYAMDTRGQILVKTIMIIVDKSEIVRNGLRSLEWPYVIALPGKNRESYYHYNFENPYLLEVGDMVEKNIEWNPKLEWLAPKEREYISDDGFGYTKDERKKTWKRNGSGVGDYMSDWYIWTTVKEKFVNPPQHCS